MLCEGPKVQLYRLAEACNYKAVIWTRDRWLVKGCLTVQGHSSHLHLVSLMTLNNVNYRVRLICVLSSLSSPTYSCTLELN